MTKKMIRLGIIISLVSLTFLVSAQPKSIKRGIAYGSHSDADMLTISKGITWWYNWFVQPETGVINTYKNYSVEYVPMAWGGGTNLNMIRAYLAKDTSIKYLLGYNEPNFNSQAKMTPTQAAAAWTNLESIANDFGLKLVSPAVNYCGDCVSENGVTYTDPVKYLDDFFTACSNCKVDYIAIHWYACSGSALKSYLNRFRKYKKPIWVTEFSCLENNPTLQTQVDYLFQAVDILENDPDVFRYAWFTGRANSGNISLFNSASGQLSELGKIYVNMPTHDTSFYYTIPAHIEAENYSTMYGIRFETTQDVSGTFNVGYIDANDWLSYNVIVPDSNLYDIKIRFSGNAAAALSIYSDNTLLTTIQTPATGGWQNWQTTTSQINLPKGKHQLKLFAVSAGFNLNWIEICDTSLTKLNEITLNNNITVMPNPVTDSRQLTITSNGIEFRNMSVELFDMTGHLIRSQTYDNSQQVLFNVGNNVNSGIYLLNIKVENNVIRRKIIIP